jgi:hypothetical protein
MNTCWGVHVWIHVFLNLIIVAGEWPASQRGSFTPAERSAQGRSGITEEKKICLLPGIKFGPSVVEPVASRYTDGITLASVHSIHSTIHHRDACYNVNMLFVIGRAI